MACARDSVAGYLTRLALLARAVLPLQGSRHAGRVFGRLWARREMSGI